MEADAEGMRAALTAHDEVLRDAIEAHGGWSVQSTPVTGCARRSRHPDRRLMPR